jgi:hypothetical protein
MIAAEHTVARYQRLLHSAVYWVAVPRGLHPLRPNMRGGVVGRLTQGLRGGVVHAAGGAGALGSGGSLGGPGCRVRLGVSILAVRFD